MTLYVRKIVLRNCGRFTVVQSDFGADYRTHTHVTSQALYASLTRGVTWHAHPIIVKKDQYDFAHDYDQDAFPVWFTPGIFFDPEAESSLDRARQFPHEALNSNYFNVLHEVYPTTSKSYGYDKKQQLKQQGRPHHTPTYGTWQSILPDYRLLTYVYAADEALLQNFAVDQTYLLGKKRTMMQVVEIEEIVEGAIQKGACMTPYLQVPSSEIVDYFQSFEILAGTLRYAVVRGECQPETEHYRFDDGLCLPTFSLPSHIGARI